MAKRQTGSVLAALVGTAVMAAIGAGIVGALTIPWAIQTRDGTAEVVAVLGIAGAAFVILWLFLLGLVFGLSE